MKNPGASTQVSPDTWLSARGVIWSLRSADPPLNILNCLYPSYSCSPCYRTYFAITCSLVFFPIVITKYPSGQNSPLHNCFFISGCSANILRRLCSLLVLLFRSHFVLALIVFGSTHGFFCSYFQEFYPFILELYTHIYLHKRLFYIFCKFFPTVFFGQTKW